MDRLAHVKQRVGLRKRRIRSTISGTSVRPRLSVHISHKHISVQIIDDSKSTTLLSVTTVGNKTLGGNMTEKSTWIGTEIGKKAKAAKIKQVVFDRNGRLYHGRVKAIADNARQEGLEF